MRDYECTTCAYSWAEHDEPFDADRRVEKIDRRRQPRTERRVRS